MRASVSFLAFSRASSAAAAWASSWARRGFGDAGGVRATSVYGAEMFAGFQPGTQVGLGVGRPGARVAATRNRDGSLSTHRCTLVQRRHRSRSPCFGSDGRQGQGEG